MFYNYRNPNSCDRTHSQRIVEKIVHIQKTAHLKSRTQSKNLTRVVHTLPSAAAIPVSELRPNIQVALIHALIPRVAQGVYGM